MGCSQGSWLDHTGDENAQNEIYRRTCAVLMYQWYRNGSTDRKRSCCSQAVAFDGQILHRQKRESLRRLLQICVRQLGQGKPDSLRSGESDGFRADG